MLTKILISLLLLLSVQVSAQEIPSGSCGLIMTYDAAGNRIKREYYCNNGSNRISNPELARLNDEAGQAKQQEAASAGFEGVDALYPILAQTLGSVVWNFPDFPIGNVRNPTW